MAKEEDLKLEGAETEEAKPAGKKKLIIIIALVVLILAGGGGAAAFFLLGGEDEAEGAEGEEAVAEEVVEEPPIPAQYVVLKPEFVVSFQVGTRQRFVQASIEVMTRAQSVVDAMELHSPMIRNEVIRIISMQDFNSLRTAEGRVALQQELKNAMIKIMEREAGSDNVEAVLFTNFVMQ
ncbi:flagellar basal body-associated FliL family protein [Thalassolituus sp.]|jgi:flagellar FliL protein|uniref:flagellar basal body-associated FliL family protein n=1 Tax=Thalassolituus sp. TaxID=2030822 RepID=UPI002605633B|nr:flagellar basal body-associated FliL family protein [uncultured Thalassolituus sp.]